MKRQVIKTGVRKWFGSDWVSLQDEIYKVLIAPYENHGNIIISGCEITDNGTGWAVSPGLIAIAGKSPEDEAVYEVAEFVGQTNISPLDSLYLYLKSESIDREYQTGGSKPIAFNYFIHSATTNPNQGHQIVLTKNGITQGQYFYDAIQNSTRRFVTDTDKTKWNNAANTLVSSSVNGLMRSTDKVTFDNFFQSVAFSSVTLGSGWAASRGFNNLFTDSGLKVKKKSELHWCSIKGAIYGSEVNSNQIIAALASQYRPSKNVVLPAYYHTGSTINNCLLHINTSGQIRAMSNSGNYLTQSVTITVPDANYLTA